MWVNEFEAEPAGCSSMYFYEPLATTATQEARPYCCYFRTVIFYEEPRQVLPDGSYAKHDEVETSWDLLGQRWTDADIGWSALAPFVQHEGQVYILGTGKVLWRNEQWQMRWLAWKVQPDDPRLGVKQ